MCPEAAQKLSELLLNPKATDGFRNGDGSAHRRGWVAELSTYLRLADPELYQHSLRVARWARRIALALGFDTERLRILNLAARFHDIGKVPFLHLVHKPGPLSLKERASLDSHPALGARMLSDLGEPFCRSAPLVEAHHQRYETDGRPALLGARVIAVGDAYDAMVSSRPYHRAVHPSEALREILRQSSRQFDPLVVSAFLDLPQFTVMVDAFTLGTLKAAAERIVAREKRQIDLGIGWVRRTFSDASGELWEAIEGEGQGVGVAPGFRRIVLRKLEDPSAPPVPGPITVAPLEVLPAEWLRGFVRLVHERVEPAAPAGVGNGNRDGAAEPWANADGRTDGAEARVSEAGPGTAEVVAVDELADPAEETLEIVWEATEAAAHGAEPEIAREPAAARPAAAADGLSEKDVAGAVVAVDCAEAPDGERPAIRRHLFRGLEVEHVRPHRVRARVRIALEDREFEGESVGADVPGVRAEVAARAALDALQKAEGSGFELALQGAKVVRAFDRKLVVVGVYALRGRDVTSLVGAALVRDSVEQAGVLAALQATNRWVAWAAIQAS